jgi:WD40 repeat protein
VVRAANGGAATVVYDLSSGERTEMTHTAGESMALVPGGETLAVARKGRLNLFNLQSGPPAQSFGEARDVETPFLTYSPDGSSIAVGSEEGEIDVFDLATGRRTRILHGGRDLRAIFFKANGDLVTADGLGDIYIWDVDAVGSPMEKITVGARIAGATVGGGVLVMGDGADWYSADLETFVPLFAPTFAHPGGITAAAISPDGSVFATGGRDGTVKIWDLETGDELMVLTGATQPIQSLAIDDDATLVAAMAADRVLRVYTLDVAELSEIGRARVTRRLTDVECRQYLRSGCPDPG